MPVSPIDYSSLLTQLDVTPLMQGLQLRNNRRQIQDMRDERQERVQIAKAQFTQEQLENKQYQTDVADLTTNFSPEKLRNLAWKYPDHQKALEDGFATYGRGVQQDVIRATTHVMGALSSGNKDVALRTLDDRMAALDKAGINTDETTALRRLIQSDDPADAQRAYSMLGIIMSGAVGPEHAAGMMETMGLGAKAEDRRRDNARLDADLDERRRHNRVMEGQGSERIGVSRDREARVAAKGSGGGGGGGGDAPASVSTVGGKTYVKRGGKWYAQ